MYTYEDILAFLKDETPRIPDSFIRTNAEFDKRIPSSDTSETHKEEIHINELTEMLADEIKVPDTEQVCSKMSETAKVSQSLDISSETAQQDFADERQKIVDLNSKKDQDETLIFSENTPLSELLQIIKKRRKNRLSKKKKMRMMNDTKSNSSVLEELRNKICEKTGPTQQIDQRKISNYSSEMQDGTSQFPENMSELHKIRQEIPLLTERIFEHVTQIRQEITLLNERIFEHVTHLKNITENASIWILLEHHLTYLEDKLNKIVTSSNEFHQREVCTTPKNLVKEVLTKNLEEKCSQNQFTGSPSFQNGNDTTELFPDKSCKTHTAVESCTMQYEAKEPSQLQDREIRISSLLQKIRQHLIYLKQKDSHPPYTRLHTRMILIRQRLSFFESELNIKVKVVSELSNEQQRNIEGSKFNQAQDFKSSGTENESMRTSMLETQNYTYKSELDLQKHKLKISKLQDGISQTSENHPQSQSKHDVRYFYALYLDIIKSFLKHEPPVSLQKKELERELTENLAISGTSKLTNQNVRMTQSSESQSKIIESCGGNLNPHFPTRLPNEENNSLMSMEIMNKDRQSNMSSKSPDKNVQILFPAYFQHKQLEVPVKEAQIQDPPYLSSEQSIYQYKYPTTAQENGFQESSENFKVSIKNPNSEPISNNSMSNLNGYVQNYFSKNNQSVSTNLIFHETMQNVPNSVNHKLANTSTLYNNESGCLNRQQIANTCHPQILTNANINMNNQSMNQVLDKPKTGRNKQSYSNNNAVNFNSNYIPTYQSNHAANFNIPTNCERNISMQECMRFKNTSQPNLFQTCMQNTTVNHNQQIQGSQEKGINALLNYSNNASSVNHSSSNFSNNRFISNTKCLNFKTPSEQNTNISRTDVSYNMPSNFKYYNNSQICYSAEYFNNTFSLPVGYNFPSRMQNVSNPNEIPDSFNLRNESANGRQNLSKHNFFDNNHNYTTSSFKSTYKPQTDCLFQTDYQHMDYLFDIFNKINGTTLSGDLKQIQTSESQHRKETLPMYGNTNEQFHGTSQEMPHHDKNSDVNKSSSLKNETYSPFPAQTTLNMPILPYNNSVETNRNVNFPIQNKQNNNNIISPLFPHNNFVETNRNVHFPIQSKQNNNNTISPLHPPNHYMKRNEQFENNFQNSKIAANSPLHSIQLEEHNQVKYPPSYIEHLNSVANASIAKSLGTHEWKFPSSMPQNNHLFTSLNNVAHTVPNNCRENHYSQSNTYLGQRSQPSTNISGVTTNNVLQREVPIGSYNNEFHSLQTHSALYNQQNQIRYAEYTNSSNSVNTLLNDNSNNRPQFINCEYISTMSIGNSCQENGCPCTKVEVSTKIRISEEMNEITRHTIMLFNQQECVQFFRTIVKNEYPTQYHRLLRRLWEDAQVLNYYQITHIHITTELKQQIIKNNPYPPTIQMQQ